VHHYRPQTLLWHFVEFVSILIESPNVTTAHHHRTRSCRRRLHVCSCDVFGQQIFVTNRRRQIGNLHVSFSARSQPCVGYITFAHLPGRTVYQITDAAVTSRSEFFARVSSLLLSNIHVHCESKTGRPFSLIAETNLGKSYQFLVQNI